MIDLKDVSKAYPNGVHALNHVNLHIDKGEFVYVIGATGSGKSTLIKVLNGEEVPDEGTVIVDGINVGALKHRKVPYYRRNVGCVFQDYRLLPKLTVFENIAFALEVVGMPRKHIRKRVMEVLELVDLKEKARSYPDELSGGQQQRVTIGRAIANKPKVLIAVFLIRNTIKMTILVRKDEIAIMRTVGAYNWYISLPFVLEGIFIGFWGALGPVLICIFGYTGLYHVMNGMFFSDMMSMLKPYPFVLCTSGGILLIGMVVGMLGSYLAVRKYLRWTR